MSLRCKPGDLAVIVRTKTRNENLGRLVEVVRPYRPEDADNFGFKFGTANWIIRGVGGPLFCWPSGRLLHERPAPDFNLRPLRDQPGVDEMLRIAGKPNETPTEIIEGATS